MKKILFSALLLTHSFIQAQVDRSIMPKPTEAKKINISDGIIYRSGSPTQAIPSPDAGAIKIDGILKCENVIIPLA